MSKQGFVIDVDHVFEPGDSLPSKAGVTYGAPDATMTCKFRIYDADRVLYYEGRCSDGSSFAPLDWAMAYAGATDIEYQDPASGRWVAL